MASLKERDDFSWTFWNKWRPSSEREARRGKEVGDFGEDMLEDEYL